MNEQEFRERQLDWIDQRLPYQPRSDTSRAAATSMLDGARHMRERVLKALRGAGIHGATDEELQRILRMNPSTERPRRIELVTAGLAYNSGEQRKTRSGRKAVVWAATCTRAA